jgi:hypothetical protein
MKSRAVWSAAPAERAADVAAAFATFTPGDANGSTQGRPTVMAAATITKTNPATTTTHPPGRRAGFHWTDEPPDDENTTPARVRSVPHEGQCSAEE